MPLGGLISLAVLLPNLLIILMPPAAVPPEPPKDRRGRLMEAVERLGQAGSFVIPFFYPLPPLRGASVDALLVMGLALLVYAIGWLRYASKGHRFVLLFAPLFGLPLPMAVAPVIYFFSAAVFLQAWPLGIAAALLAVGHLTVSSDTWARCRAASFAQP